MAIKNMIIFLSLLLFLSNLPAQKTQSSFFQQSNQFFSRYVDDGRIDYSAINSSHMELNQLLEIISAVHLSGLKPGNHKKAFLINSYNILVIKAVLADYPLASVMEISGFFDSTIVSMADRKLSLNQLEKDILFAEYPDPRLHFVLVCAAIGCPPLIDQAYMPDDLQKQLDQRTRMTLNDDRYVRIDRLSSIVYVSELFKWYEKEFTAGGLSIINYINQYRNNKIPAGYRIEFIPYDWRLNDVP